MDKEKLKEKITQLIEESKQDIIDMEGMTEPVKPENSLGRISRMDAIQKNDQAKKKKKKKKKKNYKKC